MTLSFCFPGSVFLKLVLMMFFSFTLTRFLKERPRLWTVNVAFTTVLRLKHKHHTELKDMSVISGSSYSHRWSGWQLRCSHWGTCRRWACPGKSVRAGWRTGVPRLYRLGRWSSGCSPAASPSLRPSGCPRSAQTQTRERGISQMSLLHIYIFFLNVFIYIYFF